MRKVLAACLLSTLLLSSFTAQTPRTIQSSQPQPSESGTADVIRITTELLQTDVVVTDKNEQLITDLQLSDLELNDNGKKQELHFMSSSASTHHAARKTRTIWRGLLQVLM